MRHIGLEERTISEKEYRELKRTQRVATKLIVMLIKKHKIENMSEFTSKYIKSIARSLGFSRATENLLKLVNEPQIKEMIKRPKSYRPIEHFELKCIRCGNITETSGTDIQSRICTAPSHHSSSGICGGDLVLNSDTFTMPDENTIDNNNI